MRKQSILYVSLALLGMGLTTTLNTPNAHAATTEDTTATVTTPAFSNYSDSLNAATNWLIQKNAWDSWTALAISRSPQGLTDAQKDAAYAAIKNDASSDDTPAGTYARTIIGAVSIGKDPTNFNGKNLVNELVSKIGDNGTGSLYSDGPALYALSTKDYGKESQAAINRLITCVLSKQAATGEWDNWGALDLTGSILEGLAMHRDVPGVKAAIDKAVAKVSSDYYDSKTGYFADPTDHTYSVPNANSEAQLIMGLSACGIDLNQGMGKDGTGVAPLKAFLNFQQADGSYKWQLQNPGTVGMVTQQVVYALDQYDFFKKGKGSIYTFETPKPVDSITATDKAAAITALTKAATTKKQTIAADTSLLTGTKTTANKTIDQTIATYTKQLNAATTKSQLAKIQSSGLTANAAIKATNPADKPSTKPSTNPNTGSSSNSNSTPSSKPVTNASSQSVKTSSAIVTKAPQTIVPATTPVSSVKKTNAKAPKRTIYALKKVTVYKNRNLTQKQVTYAKKSRTNRPTFTVLAKVKNAKGTWVYKVRDLATKKIGYLTTNASVAKNLYYQKSMKRVKVLNKHGINEYKTAALTKKAAHVKKNTTLKIKKLVKHGSTTRLVLTSGHYVTANKLFVIAK